MRFSETHVLIPNTMVKTYTADDTILVTVWERRWLPNYNGGVAQLGEHLPCKQGVKSSNLSISIRNLMIKFRDTYLENRILNRNELIIQLNIKTSEAMWSSD